jgi:hypothetical protein
MRGVERYLLACLLLSCQLCCAVNRREAPPKPEIQRALNSVPLAFEPNAGQAGAETKFLAHRAGLIASFAPDAVRIALPEKTPRAARLEIGFGRSARILGEEEQPGKTNYLRGKDPAAWHTGIANFARIRYAQLWPGIDLVFYGNGEHLEHDFLVSPGADPRRIAFDLRGAGSVKTDPEGNLLVWLGEGLVTFKKPVAYQETASGRRPVDSAFKVDGTKISFRIGAYDHGRALVIDPVLVFSTMLAGSTFEGISGMAVDAQGNIYVSGISYSTDFPTTAGSVEPACAGCSSTSNDGFVTKLNPAGTALVYSTFLGGTADDFAQSITVDGNGNAIVSGITLSSDFPAVNPIGSFSGANTYHLFLSSLSPTGSALNYSGVIGPLNAISAFGTATPAISLLVPLALDASGNAYLTTQTLFSTFPTTPSAIAPVPPNPPAAVLVALKVSPAGSLVYSTAIPGRAAPGSGNLAPGNPAPNTFFQNAIAVDSSGSAYIAGQANDGLPATLGVIGPAFASDSGFNVFFPQEGFLLKLNPAGSALTYATYVPATDKVSAMRVDASGNAYLGGVTSSSSLAISPNAFSAGTGCAGCQAGYLLKINSNATATLGGTYLHGGEPFQNGGAQLAHIAVDSSANILATGIDPFTMPPVHPLIQPAPAISSRSAATFPLCCSPPADRTH